MTNLIKQYRRRVQTKVGQTWGDTLVARRTKKQALLQVAALETAQTFAPPPLHEPHVIFEKSYLSEAEGGERKKVAEQLRHMSFHDHHAAQAA